MTQKFCFAALRLVDGIDWQAGGEVYAASSTFDYNDGEMANVTGVDDQVLIFSKPTLKSHYGAGVVQRQGSLQVKKTQQEA